MKERILYFLLLFLIMIIAVSEQDANSNTVDDISTCQSIDVTKNIKCLTPQIKFSLKKNFPILNNSQFPSQNLLGKDCHRKVILTLNFLELNQIKMANLKPVKLISYLPKIYHSPKNQDKNHLS